MITIQRERFAAVMDELPPLLEDHWREVALHQETVPLKPDFKRYVAGCESGRVLTLTARDDGHLIGYSIFLLSVHLHYSTCLVATNDVLFLAKSYRSGTTAGIRLIRESEAEIERECAGRGAASVRVLWHVKPKNDWSPILKRMGYEQEEIIMGKLLGEPNGH